MDERREPVRADEAAGGLAERLVRPGAGPPDPSSGVRIQLGVVLFLGLVLTALLVAPVASFVHHTVQSLAP